MIDARAWVSILLLASCAGAEPNPSDAERPSALFPVSVSRDVDLVIVVDSTDDALTLRQAISARLPAMLETLMSGDYDGDGVGEEVVPNTLHVAVTASDGVGEGSEVPLTCQQSDAGLIAGATCDGGGWASLDSPADIAAASDTLACALADVGGGCRVRQPRVALNNLLLLWGGRADFLRQGSLRVAMVIQLADDCSAVSPYPWSPETSGPLDCPMGSPGSVVSQDIFRFRLLPIAGVPVALVDTARVEETARPSPNAWFGEPFDDPTMVRSLDPVDPTRAAALCDTPIGSVEPAPELVDAVRWWGPPADVESLCRSDLLTALQNSAGRIPASFRAACLPSWASKERCSLEEGALPSEGCRTEGAVRSTADSYKCVLPSTAWSIDSTSIEAQSLCAGTGYSGLLQVEGADDDRIFHVACDFPCDADEDCDGLPVGTGRWGCEPTTRTCRRACDFARQCDDVHTCVDSLGSRGVCVPEA